MIKDTEFYTNYFKSLYPVKFDYTLASACLSMAKTMAPYDTGNLAESIRLDYKFNVKEGFTIKYPFREVNYLYALEFGSTKSSKNVGFIRNQTVPIIVSLIEGYFNERRDYSDFANAVNFTSIAEKKGIGDTLHKRVNIGFTRYKFSETKTRKQRKLASISRYNKMFYYNTSRVSRMAVHGNFAYDPESGKRII